MIRPRPLRSLIAAAALVSPVGALPALAQEEAPPKPACAALDAALPAELAPWTAKKALAAADKPADLDKAVIRPGQAVSAALPQTRGVTYVTQPEKPGGSVSHGGLFALQVDKAGTYRIALSSGAWIDVLKDGTAAVSTAHGRGPACSTVRKVVDFALTPGRYVIQISANADPTIQLMIAAAP